MPEDEAIKIAMRALREIANMPKVDHSAEIANQNTKIVELARHTYHKLKEMVDAS